MPQQNIIWPLTEPSFYWVDHELVLLPLFRIAFAIKLRLVNLDFFACTIQCYFKDFIMSMDQALKSSPFWNDLSDRSLGQRRILQMYKCTDKNKDIKLISEHRAERRTWTCEAQRVPTTRMNANKYKIQQRTRQSDYIIPLIINTFINGCIKCGRQRKINRCCHIRNQKSNINDVPGKRHKRTTSESGLIKNKH